MFEVTLAVMKKRYKTQDGAFLETLTASEHLKLCIWNGLLVISEAGKHTALPFDEISFLTLAIAQAHQTLSDPTCELEGKTTHPASRKPLKSSSAK